MFTKQEKWQRARRMRPLHEIQERVNGKAQTSKQNECCTCVCVCLCENMRERGSVVPRGPRSTLGCTCVCRTTCVCRIRDRTPVSRVAAMTTTMMTQMRDQQTRRTKKRLMTTTKQRQRQRKLTTRRRAATRTPHPSSGGGTGTNRALGPRTADTRCRDTATDKCVRRRMTASARRFFRRWAAGRCRSGAVGAAGAKVMMTMANPSRRQIFSSARTRTPARRPALAPDFSGGGLSDPTKYPWPLPQPRHRRRKNICRKNLRRQKNLLRRKNLPAARVRLARTARTHRRDMVWYTHVHRTSTICRMFSRTQSDASRQRYAVYPSRTDAARAASGRKSRIGAQCADTAGTGLQKKEDRVSGREHEECKKM
jgi:hypothetical protein